MRLEAEFEQFIELKRYKHADNRKDYRNGCRFRSLLSGFGLLKDIRVPRSRKPGFVLKVFDRYKRVQPVVDNGILKMFLMGVSTRKVRDVLDALFGYSLSGSYVSKVTKRLDAKVEAFYSRPLEDEFIDLFLEGINVKLRHISKSVKRVILVAYGVKADGSRRLISFRVGKSEGTGTWSSFLDQLKFRGLRGSNLELLISDGCPGLWAAAEAVYPFVEHQLCWVHKLRNVSRKCSVKYRSQCVEQAAEIYKSPTVNKALKVFRQWEKAWQKLVPNAVECLSRDIDELLGFLNCPPPHHKKIRTTNVIERQFREFRRRLKVMGTFPNTASLKRITFGLFVYHNTRWERKSSRIKKIAETFKKQAA